jgi:hypothetical protein
MHKNDNLLSLLLNELLQLGTDAFRVLVHLHVGRVRAEGGQAWAYCWIPAAFQEFHHGLEVFRAVLCAVDEEDCRVRHGWE